MAEFSILYDDSVVDHLDQHGVTIEEFAEVVNYPDAATVDERNGREIAYGYTSAMRYLACVYDRLDEETILAVTAFDVREP